MASIEKRQQTAAGKISWRAHYRDPEGKQRSASFATKRDAERFLVGVESDKLRGAFIAPERAAMTVGEIAKTWFAGRLDLAPSTRSNYRRWIDSVIEPKWGAVKLSDLRHSAVQAWVNDLAAERSPATVAKLHRLLSMILDAAVRDERLVRNPAAAVSLPKVQHAERQYLTHAQVDALARECGPYRLAVLFLAYTGIRFGELAALRVGRLDLMRRRARIAESVTPVDGVLAFGPTKSGTARDVPVPRFLVDDLVALVAGKAPGDLVFTSPSGDTLRVANFRARYFDRAAVAVGLDGLNPHALRHTAASLAIASGADVKVVQTMLGHAKASMTLDLYGHLFPDRLDVVADAMDTARVAALASLPGASRGSAVAYLLPTALPAESATITR